MKSAVFSADQTSGYKDIYLGILLKLKLLGCFIKLRLQVTCEL